MEIPMAAEFATNGLPWYMALIWVIVLFGMFVLSFRRMADAVTNNEARSLVIIAVAQIALVVGAFIFGRVVIAQIALFGVLLKQLAIASFLGQATGGAGAALRATLLPSPKAPVVFGGPPKTP